MRIEVFNKCFWFLKYYEKLIQCELWKMELKTLFFPLIFSFNEKMISEIDSLLKKKVSYFINLIRPQIRADYPLNLSILLRGGRENNSDSTSNGEWRWKSSDLKSFVMVKSFRSCNLWWIPTNIQLIMIKNNPWKG